MYNSVVINQLIKSITDNAGLDKRQLASVIQKSFGLTKARSVYYGKDFSIRFCSAASINFSNTVLGLSVLQRYDHLPFIVCVVTRGENFLLLANSTFLKKISHSSQELRCNNIRGSFNGSDILRLYEGVENEPANFEDLFNSHSNYTFEENLERLVEATNNIAPRGQRFTPTSAEMDIIMDSIGRSISFLNSEEYVILNDELSKRVERVETAIAIAAFIDNVNIRGRIIEYLITGEEDLKAVIMDCLREKKPLPDFFTADELGDYYREFSEYSTATDIKTKVLFLSSNPKGYNIDKLFSFLSNPKSVYLVYVVAIDEHRSIKTQLCSVFNRQLLDGTRIIHHWAGRSSRGVTQYDGKALVDIVSEFDCTIDIAKSKEFILKCFED